MSELISWYREALRARIRSLEETRAGLAGDGKLAAESAPARLLAEQLRDSGATYGFPRIAEAAAALEAAETEDLPRRIDELLVALREVAAGRAPGEPPSPSATF